MGLKKSFLTVFILTLFLSLSGCTNSRNTDQNREIAALGKRAVNPWIWQDKYGFVQANEVTNVTCTLYTAGIVSVDENGTLLHPGDMEKQINQVFDNMEILFEEADFKLSDIVKFTYYSTDVQAFTNANPILSKRLKEVDCRPATSLIGVKALFHPDCVVEIEATAVR